MSYESAPVGPPLSQPKGQQPPSHTQSPQNPKPTVPLVNVASFRHNRKEGIFETVGFRGRRIKTTNPFLTIVQYLQSFPPQIRQAIAKQLDDVSVQWGVCLTPVLDDIANDATTEAKSNLYLSMAQLICPNRKSFPASKWQKMVKNCHTMQDACKWLLHLENQNKDGSGNQCTPSNGDPDVFAQLGLANDHIMSTKGCRLSEEGRKKVQNLSKKDRRRLKDWFSKSEEEVEKYVKCMCNAGEAEPRGITRVCMYNLKQAYMNQSSSVLKAINDADTLDKDRKRILIFVLVILGIILIVVVAFIIKGSLKKKHTVDQAFDRKAISAHLDSSAETTNFDHTDALKAPSFRMPDDLDSQIEQLTLHLPK